jgi:hypothetical protein
MTPTKDQMAQEYAEKRLETISYRDLCNYEVYRIAIKYAYLDGYTAGEQSMWRSVEEELPEDDETVLTYSNYGPVLAYYSEQDKMWFAYGNYGDINPAFWMPIPPIPDTYTEKV